MRVIAMADRDRKSVSHPICPICGDSIPDSDECPLLGTRRVHLSCWSSPVWVRPPRWPGSLDQWQRAGPVVPEPDRHATVLIVEDHPHVAEVLSDLLALEGERADIAANGREALDKMAANDYRVILCDIVMPVLDGIGLYEELERRRPDLLPRIVFVSEHAVPLEGRHEAFLARHEVVTIPKPFSPADIQRALRQKALRPDPS